MAWKIESGTVNKKKLLATLSLLEASMEPCLTVYMRPDSFPSYLGKLARDGVEGAGEIAEAVSRDYVAREADRYGTGAVVFWGQQQKAIVLPPFAIEDTTVFQERPETSLLRRLLERERTVGVVLVTYGAYAVGVMKGDTLVHAKTGTGHLHKPHMAGGWSQKRFSRRIERQRVEFLRRVASRVEENFAAYAPDALFLGGNRQTAKSLIGESRYLQDRSALVSPRFFNVRKGDRPALFRTLEDVSASVLLTLSDDRIP